MPCPTPCDQDCPQPCHEVHAVTAKRDHDSDTCDGVVELLAREAEAAEREWANPDPNKRWYRSRQP